jgi:pyruvate/2-oxoglutarate/acetoin dehydrogenase E1 component
MTTSSPEAPATSVMSYGRALVDGLYEVFQADPQAGILNGHLLGLGPEQAHFKRIHDAFPDRILETPNSEAAIAGLGAGAAMLGQRLLVNFATASFSYLALSQIANEAAVAHHMSNGQIRVPVVYYAVHGVRGGGGAQHSNSLHSIFWNSPGLEIVLPSDPADAKGLLIAAFRSDNPTLFFTHPKLLAAQGPVPAGSTPTPFGKADIKRAGRDVTIVAVSYMVSVALEAAKLLAAQGIEAEVVDPRTLVPFDEEGILASVARTGRLVVVDECPLRCGVASEIAATIAERGFGYLKAAPVRVARADVPMAFSAPLEAELTPDAQRVFDAALRTMS